MSQTDNSLYIEKARNYPQCELFLMKEEDGKTMALVYNTTGLNTCPPEKYEPLDTVALAKTKGVDGIWKNPRRFWMMDHLTIALAGEPAELGGIMFNLAARMEMPPGFTASLKDQSSFAYAPMQIRRVTKYEFLAGMPVFMLRSPDGRTWVMQTYTNHVDRTLTEADLPNLGQRLKLADGWQFRSKILDRDLVIDTTGLANIVPDDLANMYQGCVDGVNNYDPWE